MPLYLSEARGLNLGELAIAVILPFVAADIGCLVGPAIVLWLERRGIALIDARRWTFTLGAVLMTSMMFVGGVTSAYAAVALLCIGAFAHQVLSVTCITLASDLFRRDELGTVAGMAGTMANLGVMIFTLLIGALVTRIGYEPFFIALAIFDLIAAAILWTMVVKPGTASRDSGIVPILLGGATTLYLGLVAGIDAAGVAGYVGFAFGTLLLILGIAIEVRARTGRSATA